MLTLLGWTRRDVIGAPLSRLVPPPLSTSLMHYMQTALTEGVHVRGSLHTTAQHVLWGTDNAHIACCGVWGIECICIQPSDVPYIGYTPGRQTQTHSGDTHMEHMEHMRLQ